MKELGSVLVLLAARLLSAQVLEAQEAAAPPSLVGTWVSTEPILVHIKFSLTFYESDYLVDCTLGQTTGTWVATEEKIHFTPLKVGINSGDVGKADVWSYRFTGPDTFMLASGPISVQLFRRK